MLRMIFRTAPTSPCVSQWPPVRQENSSAGPYRQGRAVPALTEAEAQHEVIRQEGAETYSVTRHLEALIALIAEASFNAKAFRRP